MSVTTPNMNLIQPTIGVDSGLVWEQSLNSNSGVTDIHNHTPGYGVQIPPQGLNINSDLPFGNNNATLLRSVNFSVQPSPLALPTDIGCLYVTGSDLWFNDEVGNQIQITAGGLVNATSSGISSGSATASFVASVLVVNAAANTPANIQAGSILLGNNVANSKFLTLSPPAAMGSNFSLTLPNIPGVTSIMTIDTSGNMSGSLVIDNSTIQNVSGVLSVNISTLTPELSGITGSQLANQTITATQIANNTITRTQMAAVGQQISSSCGNYSAAPGSFTTVTNLSVTITTTGRPVMLGIQPDGSGNTASFPSGAFFFFSFFRGSTAIGLNRIEVAAGEIAPVSITQLDTPTAGTYTYTFQVQGTQALIQFARIYAYEL